MLEGMEDGSAVGMLEGESEIVGLVVGKSEWAL